MNDTTRCYPRTLRSAFGMSAEDAVAIHVYRPPISKRVFLGIIKWGWIIAPAVLAITVLSGCADDVETAVLVAQDLQDAVTEAQYACGPQSAYEWVNESTVQCFTTRGKKSGAVEVAAQ